MKKYLILYFLFLTVFLSSQEEIFYNREFIIDNVTHLDIKNGYFKLEEIENTISKGNIKVIKENLSTKITEKELSLILEQELIRKGGDELSFPMIITSGKRSCFIHPYPSVSEKKISKGLGLIDFGVRYKGYCSDVTVPFSIGELSKKQNSIVKTVKDAYNNAIKSIKIGFPSLN